MPSELDRMECNLHSCKCSETTDCGCTECEEYRELSTAMDYMQERKHELGEKMARLSKIWDRLPQSGVFIMDRAALYSYTAEEMLFELVEKLELPPNLVQLRVSKDYNDAPDVNLQIPHAWLAGRLTIPENADKSEIKKLIDGYTRTIVAAACEKFMAKWKVRAARFGYEVKEESRIVVPGRN